MTITPESLPDDIAALKRIIAEMARDAVSAQAEIAKLKFQLARYRRAEFGRSSEKLAREVEQLELAIESMETDQAERLATASPAVAAMVEAAVEAQKPARRPLPEHLPREEVLHPAACACPHCGGALRRIGEEVTETLDYVPGRFKVIRHVREKLSCRTCDTVIAAPAPDHAIARGRAGAGLLAHVAGVEVHDHLPLYRQSRDLRPRGCRLETLDVGRLGRGDGAWRSRRWWMRSPPGDALGRRSTATTRRCRCWRRATARPRPGGCGPTCATSGHSAAPGRRRRSSATRPTAKASTRGRTCDFGGILQADAYAGLQRALRRQTGSSRRPAGRTDGANSSTSKLQGADRQRGGASASTRSSPSRAPSRPKPPERGARRERQEPLEADRWSAGRLAERQCAALAQRPILAKAISYMPRWVAFTLLLDDGRLGLDNNAAERALRGVAIGSKNWTVRRLRRRRRSRRRHLHADRDRQAQRRRSAGLARRRARPHRRPPRQAHRRAAALELEASRRPARRRLSWRLHRALTWSRRRTPPDPEAGETA